jgi:hypothetical protein
MSDLQTPMVILLVEAGKRARAHQKISKLANELQPKLTRLFQKQSVAYIKKLAQYRNDFKESILRKDLDAIFTTTSPAQTMANLLQTTIEKALLLGGNSLLEELNLTDLVFTLENPRAVKYIEGYGAKAVAGIDETSMELLRNVVRNATYKGWSYNKLAKDIRALFAEFSTRRTRLIAVTEVGNAYQEGNLIVGKDLAKSGLKMEKQWLSRGDSKVDPDCKANNDEGWIPVDKAFSSGLDRPLDHPGCRCVLLFRRVEGGK